jgi:hypothetical protein
MAGVYVPITDGLAMVAYLSTPLLAGTARRYAWTVVVLAAGLSGLAQAVNLAGLGAPDWRLRFGVGYWPAIATALGLHLLWLVRESRNHRLSPTVEHPERATVSTPDEPPGLALVSTPGEPAREHHAESPGEPPVSTPVPRRVSPAAGGSRRRKVSTPALPCDCGCGGTVSRATRTRHRAAARAATP